MLRHARVTAALIYVLDYAINAILLDLNVEDHVYHCYILSYCPDIL